VTEEGASTVESSFGVLDAFAFVVFAVLIAAAGSAVSRRHRADRAAAAVVRHCTDIGGLPACV
jgi:hypothetical protein